LTEIDPSSVVFTFSLSLNSCAHTHVANSVTSNLPYDNDHI
jgi:hypothetical protein